MATPTGAHVLLETVATDAHEGTQSSGAGHGQASGDFDGDQQQELLASVEIIGDANGDDERMAQNAGLGEYSCALDEGAGIRLTIHRCSALVNRPVRTRMPGGVGRAGETPALTRFGVMCEDYLNALRLDTSPNAAAPY